MLFFFFLVVIFFVFFFFFNDTATTEIYTLSLHDALPILERLPHMQEVPGSSPGATIAAFAHLMQPPHNRCGCGHSRSHRRVFRRGRARRLHAWTESAAAAFGSSVGRADDAHRRVRGAAPPRRRDAAAAQRDRRPRAAGGAAEGARRRYSRGSP